jgi:hypothetical protein
MFVVSVHNLLDPEGFWATVKERSGNIPSHLKLHALYPAGHMIRAIFLWEAGSAEEVKGFLRQAFGDLSRDRCFCAQ